MVFGCFACMAEKLRFRLVQARLRHILDLCLYVYTSWGSFLFFVEVSTYWDSFLVLRDSKGAVLDPPNVLFFAVAELGFRWCLAVSHAWRKSCVFGLSRLGCAIFWIYVSRYLRRGAFYYLFSQGVATYWGSFLVLRGFQRCRFRPAE